MKRKYDEFGIINLSEIAYLSNINRDYTFNGVIYKFNIIFKNNPESLKIIKTYSSDNITAQQNCETEYDKLVNDCLSIKLERREKLNNINNQ